MIRGSMSGATSGVRVTMGAGILALVCAAGTALAQRLPDPPAPPPPPLGSERAEGLGSFIEAYRRAGSPRMAFFTEVTGASGGKEALLMQLGARIEELFRDPEVTIVNPDASAVLNKSQMEALRRNDEFGAARMLGETFRADVVLYVRVVEQNAAAGRSYAATYELIDLRRGTTLGRWPFTMYADENGDFDAYRIGEYARAIGRKVATQFAEAFPVNGAVGGARRFTLRVVGEYVDDDLSALRDSLNAMPGVRRGSVLLRSEDQNNATSVATIELMYGGDLFDLRRSTRRAAVDELGMEADIADAKDGTLTIKLAPLGLSERERMLAGGATNARNRSERERFAQAYARAGAPAVAVIVNRATVEAEVSYFDANDRPGDRGNAAAPVQSGDGVNIIIGDRVDLAGGLAGGRTGGSPFIERVVDRELRDRRTERREQTAVDLRMLEDKLAERLVNLGVTPRDVASAQLRLTSDTAMAGRSWSDRELAYALGKESGAKIVLSGVARLVRGRTNEEPLRVVMTMRAYDVATNNVLAATSVQRALDSGLESFNQAVDEVAAEAVGKMAAQLADRWGRSEAPGTTQSP